MAAIIPHFSGVRPTRPCNHYNVYDYWRTERTVHCQRIIFGELPSVYFMHSSPSTLQNFFYDFTSDWFDDVENSEEKKLLCMILIMS